MEKKAMTAAKSATLTTIIATATAALAGTPFNDNDDVKEKYCYDCNCH